VVRCTSTLRTTAYRPASRAISAKLAIPRTFPAVATLA
jgi:hypothetical protein